MRLCGYVPVNEYSYMRVFQLLVCPRVHIRTYTLYPWPHLPSWILGCEPRGRPAAQGDREEMEAMEFPWRIHTMQQLAGAKTSTALVEGRTTSKICL